jgi:putative transposase
MPRYSRVAPAGYVQHVLNRGNEKATIFHEPNDYEAFLAILADGLERFDVQLLAFCLMRNHFHLVVVPATDVALSEYMHWTMTVHVRRYRRFRNSRGNGHIYQDRFKNFIIDTADDIHFYSVMRYVEGNAARAGLVGRAEEWNWSSLLRLRAWDGRMLLSPWPFPRPENWPDLVNAPFSLEELHRIRESANRGAPFGTPEWTQQKARELGLEATLGPVGRPVRSAGKRRGRTGTAPTLRGEATREIGTVPISRSLFE